MIRFTIAFLITLISGNSLATALPVTEDAYLMQAPQELIDQTEKVAELVHFSKDYELAVPKKAGVKVNAWNKFIAQAINPQTKNPLVIINQDWFSPLDQDQQTFLIARSFMELDKPIQPSKLLSLLPYILILVQILSVVAFAFALKKTRFAQQPLWVKIVTFYAAATLLRLFVLTPIEASLRRYLVLQEDKKINEYIVEKTQQREAAVQGLMAIHTTINQELSEGETFWEPYQNYFKDRADLLRQ